MELLNPYRAPSSVTTNKAGAQFVPRFYLLRHFFIFNVAYFVCTILYCCMLEGPTEMIASFRSPAWITTSALGGVVWLVHACIVTWNEAVRRTGPTLNAIVGAMGFVGGKIALTALENFGPQSIIIALSWAPDYLLILAFTVVSICFVAVLARTYRPQITF